MLLETVEKSAAGTDSQKTESENRKRESSWQKSRLDAWKTAVVGMGTAKVFIFIIIWKERRRER